MDINNPVIQLCIEGTQAEFQGRRDAACELYQRAWELAQDDYEACVAAHYVARCQENPEDTLRWNLEALKRAQSVGDDRVDAFYPSLFLNLGQSYARLGYMIEAQHYYAKAARLGVEHEENI